MFCAELVWVCSVGFADVEGFLENILVWAICECVGTWDC
jgi:hypothetical protein